MLRLIRNFFKAIRMTLQGESLTPSHYVPLENWIDEGLDKLDHVIAVADTSGLRSFQREEIELKLDGRMTSMERILQMVRHNLKNEYPRLMRYDDNYSMMVVQSSNFNDQYRVSQLAQCDDIQSGEVKQALQILTDHLLNLPQVERPEEAT